MATPPPPPSRSPKVALVQVFRSLNDSSPHWSWGEEARQTAAFDAALDRLADCLDGAEVERRAAQEGRDLAAKLVVIAWDRRRRPERYRELDRYTHREPEPRMATPWPEPARPLSAHAVEEYRLAWEYFLLRPSPGQWPAMQSRAAVTALNLIGSDASLPALVFVFQTAWR